MLDIKVTVLRVVLVGLKHQVGLTIAEGIAFFDSVVDSNLDSFTSPFSLDVNLPQIGDVFRIGKRTLSTKEGRMPEVVSATSLVDR